MISSVAILRCSTDKQDMSVGSQRDSIIQHFGHTHEIKDWYVDEGYSGDDETRPEFNRFLSELGRTDYVEILAWDLSRFSRSKPWKTMRDLELIAEHDKRINTVKDGVISTEDANEIVAYIHSFNNHKKLRDTAHDSLRGKVARFREGQPYGQLVPYGLARELTDAQGNKHVYSRNERLSKPKGWRQRFVLGDEDEVKTIKFIFAEFLKSDCSYRSIAETLNKQGVPSPTGKKWGYQTIIEILSNYRYAGRLTLGRDKAGKHVRLQGGVPTRTKSSEKAMRTSVKDALVSDGETHEAIIDWETFQAIQKKLADKKAKTPQRRSYKEGGYALTGVLFCGHCRKPLYGTERKKDDHNKGGKAYYCKGYSDSPNQSGCPQWRVEEKDILPLVLREAGNLIEQQLVSVRSALESKPVSDPSDAKRKKLEKKKRAYDAGMDRLIVVDDNLVPDIERKLMALKREIEDLENELSRGLDGERDQLIQTVELIEQCSQELVRFWSSSADMRSATDHVVRTADLRESLQRAGLQVFVYFEKAEKRIFAKPLYTVSKLTMSLPDLVETVLPGIRNTSIFSNNYGISPLQNLTDPHR